MIGVKVIRNKIKSIRNIQKITHAMEMVAVSKMKKTQQRMLMTRPYVENMKKVIQNVMFSSLEYKHEFIKKRAASIVAYIVVSTDRGLCGGLNVGLFRKVLENENFKENENKELSKFYVSVIGKKAFSFFTRFNVSEIVSLKYPVSSNPVVEDFLSTVKSVIDLFLHNKVSKVFLVYNKFINTMVQEPCLLQILPICCLLVSNEVEMCKVKKKSWDYIYEPTASELLDLLFIRYIESLTYQAVIENQACEQSARMVAMKNATDNASEVVQKFMLTYNKVRQAGITRELSEIVAGADAV